MVSACIPAVGRDDRDLWAGLITGVVVKPQTRFIGPKACPGRETGHQDNKRLAELFKDKVIGAAVSDVLGVTASGRVMPGADLYARLADETLARLRLTPA